MLLLGVSVGVLVRLAMDAQAMTDFVLGEHGVFALQAVRVAGRRSAHRRCLFHDAAMERAGCLPRGRAPLLALALQLGRFALLAVALALIASRFGALPLLAAAAGILAARTVAVRLGAQTMIESPLSLKTSFTIGPVPITEPVVVTWGLMAALTLAGFLATRSLTLVADAAIKPCWS